jgi:hypothetical protein
MNFSIFGLWWMLNIDEASSGSHFSLICCRSKFRFRCRGKKRLCLSDITGLNERASARVFVNYSNRCRDRRSIMCELNGMDEINGVDSIARALLARENTERMVRGSIRLLGETRKALNQSRAKCQASRALLDNQQKSLLDNPYVRQRLRGLN